MLYTSNYDYVGPQRFDITVKTGSQIFAPTWDMVKNYKKTGDKDLYTAKYHQKMRDSYKEYKPLWLMTAKADMVIVCFCPAGEFCHRLLLIEFLKKLGATYGGEV